MKAIQKICKQGNSAMVTLPRPLLYALSLRPGEMVEWTWDDTGVCTLRPWANRENGAARGPGVIPDDPPRNLR